MSIVLAHRGASGYAPENTLEAFRLAMEMGADGFELDVHVSRDGHLVVIHDETVDRTTDGHGFVRDLTLEQLQDLDASCGMPGYRGARIPTLEQVYDLIRDTDHVVNVEIKTDEYFYPQIGEKCLALEKQMHMEGRIIYSSFNHYTIGHMRRLAPDSRLGMLYGDVMVEPYDYCKRIGADLLHPLKANIYVPGFAEGAKAAGLGVNLWTVDDEATMELCLDHDIGIISNLPDIALRLRSRRN